MPKKRTQEEYESELAIKNPTVKVAGNYVNSNTPILHYCTLHNMTWKVRPSDALNGSGCPECWRMRIRNKKKKPVEQYVKELAEVNPNIVVLEEYVNALTPILHQCKLDNYKWKVTPNSLLSGHGCPICAGNQKKTTEEYKLELATINPDIEVLGEYDTANVYILHKCKKDGYEWMAKPNNVLQKKGCPMCANKIVSQKLSKTYEQYVEEVLINNPDIEVLEKYINAKTPILHKCKKDGYEWMATPSNVLSGKGSPQCKESKGERTVRQWLERNKVIYKSQYKFPDCKDKCALPFDFYLPEYNTCIEYDGGQHFFPVNFSGEGAEYTEQQFKTTQYRDQIKNKYCADNGITLLRIPYFKNVEEELNNFFIHLV